MHRRRWLQSVAHNTLGTFASRNSDVFGYWIFGMLVGGLDIHEIDLLADDGDGVDAFAVADRMARDGFRQQLKKGGLAASQLTEAKLEMRRSPRSVTVSINGHEAAAHELRLWVRLVSDLGRAYEHKQSILVAPHDPLKELQSGRFSKRPKAALEIQGFEYDWLGSDGDGHVALFSTAGGGHAPLEFLRDTESHDAAIEAVLALPASTSARFAPELPADCVNTWKLVAERGLYAYDNEPTGGPYRLVAAPTAPVLVADLPTAIATVVRRVAYPDLRFAQMEAITDGVLDRRV